MVDPKKQLWNCLGACHVHRVLVVILLRDDGWKSVIKCGNVSFESATVNICDGICDSCDRCGIESCEFYDTSEEATRRFIRALNYEQTAEFQFAKPN